MPALALLCAAQFMVILDITVVNVALPSIHEELDIPVDDLQWVVTAYTLAFGGLLLLGGRAADLFGRRRVFLAGLLLFAAASFGAALATSTATLVAARVAQGVGAALLSPAALSLVTTIFADGRERQRALAAWAAVAASGGAFGVLVGGVLTETLGWQTIFLINVPVGIAVSLASLRVLPASSSKASRGRLDVAGALLATGSLVALIFGLVEAPSSGWASAQTLGLVGAGVLGVGAFVLVEARVREPLVDLAVFRQRPFVVALLLMVVGMGTVLSAFFFSSLYLQSVLGHSPLRTGLEFLPGAIVLVVAAHLGGHLVARIGAKPVLVGGMALAGLGALLLSGISPDGGYAADVLPGLLLLDTGVGLAAAGIFITAMSGVDESRAGLASGLISTAHELGIALVLPVLATVAASRIGAGSLEAAVGADGAVVTVAFADALRIAAGLAFAAAVLVFAVLRRTDIAPGGQHALAPH
jgi:EmrB/QacA subfamily drug resistance transporter